MLPIPFLDAYVKLIGVLNYETGHVYVQKEEQYDAQVFHKFLINVLNIYTEGKIVMVLDNARIHHAKLIQPFLEENKDRLELAFLPPYSPNLNPIEGLWKWLKNAVIYNVFYKNVHQIKVAVQEFIQYVNLHSMEIVDRLCVRT